MDFRFQPLHNEPGKLHVTVTYSYVSSEGSGERRTTGVCWLSAYVGDTSVGLRERPCPKGIDGERGGHLMDAPDLSHAHGQCLCTHTPSSQRLSRCRYFTIIVIGMETTYRRESSFGLMVLEE